MSTVPHPDRVWELIEPLERTLEEISKLYDEAYGYAFDKRAQGPDENRNEKISGTIKGDPTAQIAMSQQFTRKRLVSVFHDLERLANRVPRIRQRLDDIFKEPEDEYEPLASYVTPTVASSDDHQQATRAREKRECEQSIQRLKVKLSKEQERYGRLSK